MAFKNIGIIGYACTLGTLAIEAERLRRARESQRVNVVQVAEVATELKPKSVEMEEKDRWKLKAMASPYDLSPNKFEKERLHKQRMKALYRLR